MKGIYERTPEILAKQRYERTPEILAKQRQVHLGKKHSPESIEKMRVIHQALFAGHVSRRQQAKLDAARPRAPKVVSLEVRERIRQRLLGRSRPPEVREKLRQSALKVYAERPEIKQKLREARLKQILPKKMTSIEVILLAQFKKRRLPFEMHKKAFNRFIPDFTFEGAKLFVQADGDYWHGPKAPPQNLVNDAAFDELARAEGWSVWRFSESVIESDPEACGKAVATFVHAHTR